MFLGYTLLGWAKIVSALSTLFLIYLYWKMAEIQRSQTQIQEHQTDIMERQSQLMAASYKPDIRVDSDKTRVTTNEVTIPVTNLGNDSAKNLQIRCDAHLNSSTSKGITLESSTNPLRRVSKSEGQSVSEVRNEKQPEPDDTILEGEQGIEFRSAISLALSSRDEGGIETIPFERGVSQLVDMGVDEIGIHLFLEFEDVVGQQDEKQIYTLGRHAEIETGMTLEDIMVQGNQSATAGTLTIKGPPTRIQQIRSWIRQLPP